RDYRENLPQNPQIKNPVIVREDLIRVTVSAIDTTTFIDDINFTLEALEPPKGTIIRDLIGRTIYSYEMPEIKTQAMIERNREEFKPSTRGTDSGPLKDAIHSRLAARRKGMSFLRYGLMLAGAAAIAIAVFFIRKRRNNK
ncbi:MAG: LPXTG cell wall anchor domain-containing protein, partial [Planctomycetota bacterium]